MFLKKEDGADRYEIIPRKAADVFNKLDPAVYTLKVVKSWSGMEVFLELNKRYRGGVPINTGVFAEARDHFEFFISPEAEETRGELGLMNKMALIFNGGPGTGKTFLAGQLMERLVKEKDAICIMSKGEPAMQIHELIDSIRLEDPDRWIGILIDEYEKSNGNELDMLSFLDGTNSRKNVFVIATVNSTKRLPETIINRIGRVERVYNFDTEDAEVIKAMIVSVIPQKYIDKIDAEAIALEFIEFGIKPSIDFITVLVRNKIYEIKAGKPAPELLDGIKKAKADKRNSKKKVVGFATPNDNRAEVSEKELKKEAELEEVKEEMAEKAKAFIAMKIMQSVITQQN